jgi:hypothetical protein
MKLRDYQTELSNKATKILTDFKLVLLVCAVRTGKTLIALQTAQNYNSKNVLFVTKIKAFSSIKNDYEAMNYNFKLTIINKESLHKVDQDFDLVIYDEFHQYSAYPKASVNQKIARQKYGNLPIIMLSGTPTPEGWSQWFHSLQLSNNSPFKEYINFYKWAKDYVDIKDKNLGYAIVKDYSNANITMINEKIKNRLITFTQKEAGFTTSVKENVIIIEMEPITYKLINRLQKDLFLISNTTGKEILADTAVKLQSKLHQLYSGTIKFEDGTSKVIDYTKANFIKTKFEGKKIAIFYKFKKELEMLKEVFLEKITTELDEFNTTDKNIAYQFVSGREGVNLSKADYLIAFNIDFSATTYFQFRDRMTIMDRLENEMFWIFSKGGIEEQVYKQVIKKKNFTLATFKKNYGL